MSSGVVVGLMSGTSLDGISAAVARFRDAADGRIDVDLLAYLSRPYTNSERTRLSAALGGGTPAEYCRLNFDLGGWLGDAAVQVMAEAGVASEDIAAIASHGQTIWHEPGHSTWQSGEVAVIDGVTKALRPDLTYDIDGKMARAGNPNMQVVKELLAHPYFSMEPPKSTGRELFNSDYVQKLISTSRALGATDEDIVATAVQLTADSVGDSYRRFIAEPVKEVLVSGGGARNPALFDAIRKSAAPIEVRHFDDVFFDGEAKEAVAFALLGYLHVTNHPGNVPSATGARGPRVLGKRTPA